MEWAQPLTKHVLRGWDLLRSILGLGIEITETTFYICTYTKGRPISSLQHKVHSWGCSFTPTRGKPSLDLSLQHIATGPNPFITARGYYSWSFTPARDSWAPLPEQKAAGPGLFTTARGLNILKNTTEETTPPRSNFFLLYNSLKRRCWAWPFTPA